MVRKTIALVTLLLVVAWGCQSRGPVVSAEDLDERERAAERLADAIARHKQGSLSANERNMVEQYGDPVSVWRTVRPLLEKPSRTADEAKILLDSFGALTAMCRFYDDETTTLAEREKWSQFAGRFIKPR